MRINSIRSITLFYILVIAVLIIITVVLSIYYRQRHMIQEVYLDNNATTLPPPKVGASMIKWLDMGNSSASYTEANKIKKMIDDTRTLIYDICLLDPNVYEIIFNSGASEGNAFVIKSICESYWIKYGTKVHIITSTIEHKSILNCIKHMCDMKMCEATYIQPNTDGIIQPKDVESAIRSNTVLISIMYANNEIGSINNIHAIGKIAKQHNVPMHSDVVQIFGKYALPLDKLCIDIATLSFHKFYGPQGIGAVIIKKSIISGFSLQPQIFGSQMNGIRGGTENICGIAGALTGLKYNFAHREIKTQKLVDMITYIYNELRDTYSFNNLDAYLEKTYKQTRKKPIELVLIGPPFAVNGKFNAKQRLPNTLLIAICKNVGDMFCNVELRDDLLKEGFIVSIGSACNTQSTTASHVIKSFNPHLIIRRGVIRISIGDQNTTAQIKAFVKALIKCITKQCSQTIKK